MPQRCFRPKQHVKIDFSGKYFDLVHDMYEYIEIFGNIGRTKLMAKLQVTPTKFYQLQRDCLELYPISYDKKVSKYSLVNKLGLEHDLQEIENKLETKLTNYEKQIINTIHQEGNQEINLLELARKSNKLEEAITI